MVKKNSIALILSVFLLLSASIGTTFAYVVTQTPSLMNLFIPGYGATGDLVIEKEITHPFGPAYQVRDDLEFTFDVDFGSDYASKSVLSSIGLLNADENGVVQIKVKPGSSVEFNEIKTNTSVSVTEHQDHAGFSTVSASQSAVIGRFNETVIEFVNDYVPSPAVSNVNVNVTKLISGRDWMDGDYFVFRLDMQLYSAANDVWNTLGEKTVAYDSSNPDSHQFSLNDLIQSVSFDQIGTYCFRLSEVGGTVSGMTSETVSFDVMVTDHDMDGSLEISEVKYDGSNVEMVDGLYSLNLTVVNKYLPSGSDEIEILIHKTLNDLSGQNKTPEGFTFSLYDEHGAFIKSSKATSSTGETSIKMNYSAADAGNTYTYILKEDQGIVPGLSYDEKEVKLQVSVIDNYDGTVSAVVYEFVEPEVIEITPENLDISAADVPQPTPTVEPANEDTSTPETTEDTVVTEVSETTPEPSESADPSETETPENTETPVSTPETSEIPETTPETVVLYRVPESASDCLNVSFVNTYDPIDAHVVLSGDKDLTGRVMNSGEFAFELIKDGTVVETVSHDSTGYFEFSELGFDRVGTYVYTVKENSDAHLGGVIYDESVYTVRIVVNDDNGVLVPSVKITDKFGSDAELKFVNTYHADKVNVKLSGHKEYAGNELEPEDFIFDLIQTDESFTISSGALQSVKNNADGDFVFDALSFDSEGSAYYVIKENSSVPKHGVTYDASEYHVVITVTDNLSGHYQAEIKMTKVLDGNETEADQILFVNSYDPDDVVLSISGLKLLNNASLEEGMFAFDLYETDESFVIDGLTPMKSTVNDADGRIVFDALTYTEEKIHYYVVKEDSSCPMDRIEYDTDQVNLTVEVVDHDGQLETIVTGMENIVFENTYVPEASDLQMSIGVFKRIDNTGTEFIGPENFEFILENQDSKVKSSVKSDASGNAEFVMTYTEEDAGKVFTYKLYERNDGRENVTYSTAAFEMSVEIVLNEHHELTAVLKQNGQEVNQLHAEFVNVYHKNAEAEPSPGPSLPEAPNTGDDSQIELYALMSALSLLMLVLLVILKKRLNKK